MEKLYVQLLLAALTPTRNDVRVNRREPVWQLLAGGRSAEAQFMT
jgi:hypothetical protein